MLIYAVGSRPALPSGDVPAWTTWYVRAQARQGGLRNALLDRDGLTAVCQSLESFLEGQKAYHQATAARFGALHERLAMIGKWLFFFSLGISVTVFIVQLFRYDAIAAPAQRWLFVLSAGLPALGAASYGVRVIGDRLRQLSEAGDSVYRPLQTKKLHELRILAKRLRYAVELFAACWGDEFKKFAAEIARFQTSLGELHDCDVWIVNLGARLKHDGNSQSVGGRERWRNNEAVVWLLHHFASERTKHYCYALARWHKWETEGFLDRLRAVLNADFPPKASLPQSRKRSQKKSSARPKPPVSISSR